MVIFLNQILHLFTVTQNLIRCDNFHVPNVEILENEGLRYTKDIRQLKTRLDMDMEIGNSDTSWMKCCG